MWAGGGNGDPEDAKEILSTSVSMVCLWPVYGLSVVTELLSEVICGVSVVTELLSEVVCLWLPNCSER